jgi:hypothetical protein
VPELGKCILSPTNAAPFAAPNVVPVRLVAAKDAAD